MLRKKKHEKLATLHEAVAKNDIEAAENCDLDSDSLNGWDKQGCTPLNSAIIKGDSDMVKFLIGKGADVNGRNKSNHAPLHVAMRHEKKTYPILKMLLDSENINLHVKMMIKSQYGNSYIHLDEYALFIERPQIAELIDEKMRQERLKHEAQSNELKMQIISLEEKLQSTMRTPEEVKLQEKSPLRRFGLNSSN